MQQISTDYRSPLVHLRIETLFLRRAHPVLNPSQFEIEWRSLVICELWDVDVGVAEVRRQGPSFFCHPSVPIQTTIQNYPG